MRFWKVVGKLSLANVLNFAFAMMVAMPLMVIAGIYIAATSGGVGDPLAFVEQLESYKGLNTIVNTLGSASAIGAALLMYAAFEKKAGWPLGLRQLGAFRKLAQGLGLGILLISVGFLIILGLGGVRITGTAFDSAVVQGLLLDLILFITVGFSEEIFSRGYTYGLVRHHYGAVWATVVSSVLFALLHSMNPAVWDSAFPMLNLFLAGVLLALLREWSGGLWVPIGMHITWNFFQGDVYGMAVSGTETSSIVRLEQWNAFVSGGAFGLEGSFADTLVSLAAIGVLVLVLRRRKARAAG
ncbi:CPBP family intramembrane glutamic endopeptidase [Paenibacillus thermotolerans]|uniref:CPBP family intramembrane glutamic endopeptidase n=1 Tax=Paenibacillus thermotolerans TaxID=3027807 RepID=UPI002368DC56|nr:MULTISPECIES: CPBP family intramembrane glutamic endopeptidase [unclassified Paenibacillus]